MASGARMLYIGIKWLVGIFTLSMFAFFGGAPLKGVSDWLMTQQFGPTLAPIAGGIGWIQPLFYTMLLLIAIALTYRMYQQTVEVTAYYSEGNYGRY
jgi:hypothetical protein